MRPMNPVTSILVEHLLRIAAISGYARAMDALRRTDADRIQTLEDHLMQLRRQRKEAMLQAELATSYLRSLDHQIVVIETDIELARGGQLSFDLRPGCPGA